MSLASADQAVAVRVRQVCRDHWKWLLSTLLIVGVIVLSLRTGSTNSDPNSIFDGCWQSDEKRTLIEMSEARIAGRLSGVAEANFLRWQDGFFGQLRVEYASGRERAWFPDQSPDSVPWEPYWLQALGDGRYRARSEGMDGPPPDRLVQLDAERQCYAVDQAEMGFREWFCRCKP